MKLTGKQKFSREKIIGDSAKVQDVTPRDWPGIKEYIGNYLPATGGTISGNLTVTGNATVTGNTALNGNTDIGNADTDTVGLYGVTKTARQTHIGDASTSHALNPVFSDTEVEGALDALGTIINAILVRLETIGINKTS